MVGTLDIHGHGLKATKIVRVDRSQPGIVRIYFELIDGSEWWLELDATDTKNLEALSG